MNGSARLCKECVKGAGSISIATAWSAKGGAALQSVTLAPFIAFQTEAGTEWKFNGSAAQEILFGVLQNTVKHFLDSEKLS